MYVVEELAELLLKTLLPILILILVLTMINIVRNYIKYGTKIFSSFKKYDLNGKMKDLIIDVVKSESHKEVLIVSRDENSFYAITNYNIFGVFIFDYGCSLSGSIRDVYLKKNNGEIVNPLPKFLNDNNKILEKGINFKTIYINTKKEVKINIEGLNEIYTIKDFSYQLYRKQHSDIKYSKEEMVKIEKEIEDIVNGNNQN